MFDNYVLSDGSVRNVKNKDGQTCGFSMLSRVNYYRGIPLTMVHDLSVELDGEAVDKADIRFSVDGEDWFTPAEMETVTTYKWEFGEEATVMVVKDGGLTPGKHTVTLAQTIRTEYIPVPFIGKHTVTVDIQ